jgi:dTDP-4-dehydrorhamnose 3,5-epimerase
LQDQHGFTFTRLSLPEVILISGPSHPDSRGQLAELCRAELFRENGIEPSFAQENLSVSRPGALRGLHYQLPPHAQAKLVMVLRGTLFDVVVDVRRSSPTFGHHVTLELSAEKSRGLYVPEGFAHGFCVVSSEDAYVCYKLNRVYAPSSERGIVWSDPALGIAWPRSASDLLLSERDERLPGLDTAEVFP